MKESGNYDVYINNDKTEQERIVKNKLRAERNERNSKLAHEILDTDGGLRYNPIKYFKKRGRSKSSFVYKYFSYDQLIFICNICFKTLPYSGSLTNKKSHLRSKHKRALPGLHCIFAPR